MATKEKVNPDLSEMDRAELDRLKIILDIQNLNDDGLPKFEIFIKRRVVPIFLPFITLLVTIFFFSINFREAEKSKALDRYKSEVDMVKMVWADMKEMDTVSPAFKTSKKFLIEMYNSNFQFYKSDSVYLGIGKDQRPIMVLTNINSGMHKAIAKIEKNSELADALENVGDSKSPASKHSEKQSVLVTKSPDAIKTVDDIAGNALKVYIQYTGNVGSIKTKYLAAQLKPYYIVPPIEFVGNNKDDNEIRYYTDADHDKATQLAKKIKDITGLDFRLKNINNTKIKNTIEVWYCDSSAPAKSSLQEAAPAIEIIPANKVSQTKQFQGITAPGSQSTITDGITVYMDQYDAATETALLRINDNPKMEFKKGVAKTIRIANSTITITVTNFKRVRILKAVYYDIVIETANVK